MMGGSQPDQTSAWRLPLKEAPSRDVSFAFVIVDHFAFRHFAIGINQGSHSTSGEILRNIKSISHPPLSRTPANCMVSAVGAFLWRFWLNESRVLTPFSLVGATPRSSGPRIRM